MRGICLSVSDVKERMLETVVPRAESAVVMVVGRERNRQVSEIDRLAHSVMVRTHNIVKYFTAAIVLQASGYNLLKG